MDITYCRLVALVSAVVRSWRGRVMSCGNLVFDVLDFLDLCFAEPTVWGQACTVAAHVPRAERERTLYDKIRT